MIHTNPGLERDTVDRTDFVEFLTALQGHVKAYGKPVVLAHGYSHYFRDDKPSLVKPQFCSEFHLGGDCHGERLLNYTQI